MKINNHYLVKLKYKNEVYEKNFFSGEMGKKLNINYDMSTELLNFFYYNYVFDGKIFTLEAKKYPDEGVFNLIIKDAGGKDE